MGERTNDNFHAANNLNVMIYGDFGDRTIAMLIDAIISLAVALLIGFLYLLILGPYLRGIGARIHEIEAGAFVIVGTIQLLYFVVLESSNRQATYGKRIRHLKVVNLDGNRISFYRSIVRYLLKIISALMVFIGFIMVIFTKRKQGLHDIISGTLVLKSVHSTET